MLKKPAPRPVMRNDGYRPLTEGYQPGSQVIQKGFTPPASQQPPPPKGGSSASKPASTAVGVSKK